MNFDEQKLKRLDYIRLSDNQYENVRHIQHSIEFKKRVGIDIWIVFGLSFFINFF